MKPFEFLPTGDLSDGEIYLKLIDRVEAHEAKRFLPSYLFRICLSGGQEVGGISFRAGENALIRYYGHIGYAVDEEYRGHNYAAKACWLIFRLAKRHGFKSVVITCNPDNLPSVKTCEKVGGVLKEIVDLPEDNDMYLRGERQKCVYVISIESIPDK